jgi:hypothetical protein
MSKSYSKRALGVASALAVVGGALVVGGAAADATTIPGSYEARLSTASQPITGQRTVFNLTFTNDAPPNSFDLLRHASATITAGFLTPTAPATVVDSDGQTWTVSISANTVTIDTSVGLLPTEGEVTVPVTATAPSAAGIYQWPTSATGFLGSATNSGAYTRVGSEPAVTVATGTAVTCNTAVCDTNYIGDENDTLGRIVTEGSGTDVVTVFLTAPQYTCSGGENQGKQLTYTTQNLGRKVTGYMQLDKRYVNLHSDNGASHYDFCYQSKTPFTQYDGTPAAAIGGFYVGLLPGCSTTGNVAPCLLKRNKTGSGDMFGAYLGHAGDPGSVWDYVVVPGGGGIST